ncbi:MAG: Carboxylate-amine ligase YbdK [Methanoregula sp. PtaU1.Bin051]|nr:MAG: Carboxylate-amine ligase YbdK [Methanoregula sp. PtaU1.Bin051]
MTIGTEHEFSINSRNFTPLPVSDEIIRSICGSYAGEILFGDVNIGKELQKTVLEFVPKTPSDTVAGLERQLVQGIAKFHHIFHERYTLLGLGMHPTLTLDQTSLWDHGEKEYYETYDRIFNIRQHGWLNVQALQINLSYASEKDLVTQYNRIRALLPYLVAVTAASPVVEGALGPACDNRLRFYRANQEKIPVICNGIIPKAIDRIADYRRLEGEIFTELKKYGGEILCEEWVNSAGLIVRSSRRCLEIRALDEQECIRSDMAVCAFVRALLRCRRLDLPDDRKTLLALLEVAVRNGTAAIRPELDRLYTAAWDHATADERQYLPVIRERITHGSLAELIRKRLEAGSPLNSLLLELSSCLYENRPFLQD